MENMVREKVACRVRIKEKKKDGFCIREDKEWNFSKFSQEISLTNPSLQKHCGDEEEDE